jgi:hypothetical protein
MRRPEPWYRTSKAAWFVQIGDKQIRLAKGPKETSEKEAFDAYYKPMAHRPEYLPQADEMFIRCIPAFRGFLPWPFTFCDPPT